ncbi:MAG: acetyltransferase, GNAT family [uncultured bacterium]|nr:MAG: acetyltransferase, GNAT family [uncultured bacterium]OGJ47825.1 MAG: hypothetical protein A2344_01520 [Candidatus Peregrinibacteria bacterium RIFOXYB12_FULL_41_12]OGJ53382.1 MAG: hypothetical protein A2448_00925 [Candidatus Peregrinibacteria bacterium RIFOXYC2_FULL_41_22]OGJ54479.1 MAG: hypothetical protein A2336_04420 [Candidatus Peregrinibacteria bacterium RIFOXYB2_FULL_41_88]
MTEGITIRRATTEDIPNIQTLQQASSLISIENEQEKAKEGYITWTPTREALIKIMEFIGIICATDTNGKVIGYEIPAPLELTREDETFKASLATLNDLEHEGIKITGPTSINVGQIAIDREFKGNGIAEQMHAAFIDMIRDRYKLIFTGIATDNPRSTNLAKKIGLKEISRFERWILLAQIIT